MNVFMLIPFFCLAHPTVTSNVDSLGGGAGGMPDLSKIFAMMGGGSEGCKMSCPGGSKPRKDPNHVPTSNGCGSFGLKLDVSNLHGFTECCDVHDRCYDTCNSNRDTCDEDFKECLNDACHLMGIRHKLPKQKVESCEGSASIMNQAAVGLGCMAYKEAQRNACLCNGKKLTKEEWKKMEQKNDL